MKFLLVHLDNKEIKRHLQENRCLANWSTITCSTSTSSTCPTSPSSSTTSSQSIFQVKMSSSLSSPQSLFRHVSLCHHGLQHSKKSPTNAFLGTETLQKPNSCFLTWEHPRGRRWTFADNKHHWALQKEEKRPFINKLKCSSFSQNSVSHTNEVGAVEKIVNRPHLVAP